jgi:hypothetical protein
VYLIPRSFVLIDCSIGQDVQLKILQTLPALLHNYSDDLSGELLAHVLEVCATLQASKVAAVSNTAVATLQQLVSSAFEKVLVEDGKLQQSSRYPKVSAEPHKTLQAFKMQLPFRRKSEDRP